ncbi:unnamed protein product [Leuciscus chuanchicus]
MQSGLQRRTTNFYVKRASDLLKTFRRLLRRSELNYCLPFKRHVVKGNRRTLLGACLHWRRRTSSTTDRGRSAECNRPDPELKVCYQNQKSAIIVMTPQSHAGIDQLLILPLPLCPLRLAS